ncbi:hypothetical protein [Roseateles chitinivorans]|uniref:hypothetical protein n=1 Tax=Roseateles chitinivorans TaxID=2917965 RepID=UPI003D670210
MTLLATPLHAHPALSGFPTHPARLDTDVRKDAVPTPTALRSRASQLHAAACLWPGADDALRGQTQAILQTANRFHADPLTHPQQLAQLDRLISALPQDLLRVAGHFAALDADRQEADRLTAALDGIVRTRRVSGAELCTIRNRVEGAQLRIDAARKDLEAGQLKPMGEHAATIRGQLAFARTFLERHQFIESRSTHADVPHPAQAPQPGKPKVSPSTLLHSALSHLARTAKSARKALVRQLPSTPPSR